MMNNVTQLRQQWPELVASESPATPQAPSQAQVECATRLVDLVFSRYQGDAKNWPEIRGELIRKVSNTSVFVGRKQDPAFVYKLMRAEIPKSDISR